MAFFTKRAKEHNKAYEQEMKETPKEFNPKRITQEQRVVEYINEFGSITSLEAFRDLGVTRLSAKIYNLRKRGYIVVNHDEKCKNRYGDVVHYVRYSLKSE